MAPKFLPPELLFEIVAFMPARGAVPNAFTSCWLLHSLLLQRVTKWKQQMAEDRQIKFLMEKMDEKFAAMKAELKAEISEIFAEMKAEISEIFAEMKAEISGKFAEIQDQIQDLKAEINQKAAKISIEVPAQGLTIQQATKAGLLDLESGQLTIMCDTATNLSLAKAIEIGMLDPHSMTVCDSSHGEKRELHLDKALNEGISSPRIDLDNLDLHGKVITATSVLLMWNRGKKPSRGNYGGYQIRKMVRDDGHWLDVHKVPYQQGKNTYEWLYDNLKPKTFYLFRLKIINDNGIAGQPKILEVRTPAQVKKRTSVASVKERSPWRK